MSGIYSITNVINGHRYIGSSVNLAVRWGGHLRHLHHGTHHSPRLQSAYRKYGIDAFSFEVLEECEIGRLIEREQWWIDSARPEYNVAPRAANPMLGRKHTAETRAKMSASADREHVITDETRTKMLISQRSPEGRIRMSVATRGRTISPESRAKMSAVQVGRKASARARANMSAAQKGHGTSAQTRARISETKAVKSGRIAWG